nr:retrovirus-related Pol polyprotein from transposon TNT 1-94 [Tanacetum cinerariifolium]
LRQVAIIELRRKLELAQKQKDEIQLTVENFKNSSKNLSKLLDCQIVDKCKTGLGYNAVPPPYTGNFMPPKPNFSFCGLEEFVNEPIVSEPTVKKPVVEPSEAKASADKPKDKGVIDSGCSRHMTGNMSYLIDYEEIDGGYVAFGGNPPKEGKSQANVQSKLNSVLFNDTECIVLSPNFKLIDESQVLLRVPRKDNMYSVDLKNIVPKGAKRRNRTLIEAARTMLADFKLPTTFWAKAVKTACYVQNRVLVIKPHNPYELFHGRMLALSIMRPFRCPVTILNTKDHLGKFDGKADEGFFNAYSLNSKAFIVFNSKTRIVEENLHNRFNENTPNVVGTQSNNFAGSKVNDNAGQARKEKAPSFQDDKFQPSSDSGKKVDEDLSKEGECKDQQKEDSINNTKNEDSINNTKNVNATSTNGVNVISANTNNKLPFDPEMPALEDISTFNFSSDHEDDDEEADMNNLDTTIQVSHVPTTRIHKDHPLDQVIGDVHLTTQIRHMSKNLEEHGFVTTIHQRTNLKDLENYLFACFLSQEELEKYVMVNPTIYTSCIEQFWTTVKAKTVNGEVQLQALVDGKNVIITESTQLEGMSNHNRIYVAPSHTKKMFGKLKRVGKGFSGREKPLFPTMMVQAQEEIGKGSANPTDPHHIPTIIQPSTSQPQRKQNPRKTKRKDNELPQTSGLTTNVADKAVNEEKDDSLVRAATTASSLEAECQDTIRDTIAQTRSENVSKFSNDSLLTGVNTPQSDKDSLKLEDVMELCITLQSRVLALEQTKATQANEIDSLKTRVKKLEKKQRSKTHKLKRLYKVSLTARVESSYDNEDLGKDASKHRRISDINADEGITLVSTHDDAKMFDVDQDLHGKEVFVAKQDENVVEKEVDHAQV